MDFYILEKDKRLNSPITPKDILGLFNAQLADEMEKGNLSPKVFFLNESKQYEETDFIFFDTASTILNRSYRSLVLLGDKYKSIFSKYNLQIEFKPIAIINKSKNIQMLYWLCKIPLVIELDSIEANLYSIISPYHSNRILRVALKHESKLIVTVEVAESILRRGCIGAVFTKVESEVDTYVK